MSKILVALLVLSSSVVQAASLYSGLSRGSVAPPAGPIGVLSASRLEGPSTAQAAPALPEAIALPSAQAAAAKADAADGIRAEAGALPALQGMAAGASSGVEGIESAFDGSFLAKAIETFHPSLPAGQTPGVAAKFVVKPEGVPTDADMEARMRMSPLTNPEREAAVIALYQAAGAGAKVVDVAEDQAPRLDLYDTVQRQDAGDGKHNFIVVKKGRADRVVVVGGHHDKVDEGAGTIDNWTGATMVTNLYQAMKDVDTDATFVFVAFAREEEGLVGSRRFARSLPKSDLARIDSMVNLDTLGVDGTFSWGNNSTRSLLDLVAEVAKKEKRDLQEITLWGGDGDSSTFRKLGIAAMTLFGASPEVIWDIIHSSADTIAAFSLPHYRNAYLLTLALLKALDKQPVKAPAAI